MNLEKRALAHAALGDGRRLSIVDRLTLGDLTVAELAAVTGMKGNLLAHHLDVLEHAGRI
jgi:DNA-binding transcriptional ArsR family regulator